MTSHPAPPDRPDRLDRLDRLVSEIELLRCHVDRITGSDPATARLIERLAGDLAGGARAQIDDVLTDVADRLLRPPRSTLTDPDQPRVRCLDTLDALAAAAAGELGAVRRLIGRLR